MLVREEKKDLLCLLLCRWDSLIQFAAIEESHRESILTAEAMEAEIPHYPDLSAVKPIMQIEIIKNQIIKLMPEARFIAPAYDPPTQLCQDDFIDVYIIHNEMSISKVRKLIRDMGII